MYRKRTKQERFWEILPGLQFWVVFFGSIWLSYYRPVWAALFIICFDLYWVMKAVNTASHLIAAYKKFRFCVTINWGDYVERLKDLPAFEKFLSDKKAAANTLTSRHFFKAEIKAVNAKILGGRLTLDNSPYYHLILIPFSDESFEVLDSTFQALSDSDYPKEKMLLVLAGEQRAGEASRQAEGRLKEKYGPRFFRFFVTCHPDGLPGEIKGKSANASYAINQILPELEKLNISVPQVLVSNFDSDTIVHPEYFSRVMYEFLLAEKPYRQSYQPVAVYNNNIWDSPAIIRVVSVSNSFWQFTESSRPDRLRTFSSHTMTLKALLEVGLWKKDIVNEDGYIFWQCYLRYNGDYRVSPLFIPISLDTCLADSTWQTMVNQYKQKRRWAYNVEYYPQLIPKLLKSGAPLWDKIYKLYQYVEGNFNWATASILIVILGRLPLYLGGDAFNQSVVGYNLPKITVILLNTALIFLIFSVYVNLVLLPPRPKKYSVWRSIMMYLQWVFVPIVSVIFGSLPAVEAQTRLMFGQYLEFWVTPKARKGENTGRSMREMRDIK
ncbi:MAG: glycosyltransferase family 2 protein [Candidatus Doudnabacteria bacterium]|nr:glycosyltransferase family 2 protein [Candidatus Doudnabacteria bacterium]